MEVTIGWATEYARSSFRITVDEVDMCRILDDGGLDAKTYHNELTSAEAFKLLDTEARIFAEAEKLHHLPKGSPDRAPIIDMVGQLKALQKRNLDKIRERVSAE